MNETEKHPPSFDPSRIKELENDLGAATTRDLLAKCLVSMDQHLSDIKNSATRGDPVKAKRAAHDLKGVCAQFGAAHASEIARQIEVELENTSAIESVLGELADSITHASARIQEICVQM